MLLRSTLCAVTSIPNSVVLVHGWGGSFESTWQSNGFTALLADGGKSVIGVDLLGHGEAPKPHQPEAYADLTERIVDALPDEPVAAIGFSLGAITLMRTAVEHPQRFERLVLAGIGTNVLTPEHEGAQIIADGLQALIDGADPSSLPQAARHFAQYAQQPGNDLRALHAVMTRPRGSVIDESALRAVTCPVLVVVGDQDFVYPGDDLAAAFPDGRCVTLPKTDHFATTESFGFFDAALEFVGALG